VTHASELTTEERMEAGRGLRGKVPHEKHAEFRPSRTRPDPVAILEKQGKDRLQQLVPIRYARMLQSPFAFLRGSAAVMAADLADTPVTGLDVQACGDMHVANFGFFASAERNLVFGINDFDETLKGPWEWDLKRLVASAWVAGRYLGADEVLCEEGARAAVQSYRRRIREYATMSHMAVWYSRLDEQAVLGALGPEAREGALRIMAKAKGRGHVQVLQKLSSLVDDQQRIVELAPFVVRETHTEDGRPIAEAVSQVLRLYAESLPEERRMLFSRYRLVDVARKVVGVGSVGTRCWVLLLTGNGPGDPLFLQFKEAQPSVLAAHLDAPKWDCEGRRVVVGQRLIQGAPDIFLGWGKVGARDFYMRQLRDMKGGVEMEPGKVKIKNIPEYTKMCGWALALVHAKSGDAASIAGYVGKSEGLDDALARFALAYADQTIKDHAALAKAARSKRIVVAKVAA
jgi:uncharacterized protein (DUF2252 family)